MASESNFIDFGDLFIDADLYAVSNPSISPPASVLRMQGFYPPCDLNFFALEDGPNFHGIFGPTLPLQVPHSTGEFLPDFFPEMPPGTSSTPGVTQNAFHSFQTSHETPILQPRTTVAPPSNAVRDPAFSPRWIRGAEGGRFPVPDILPQRDYWSRITVYGHHVTTQRRTSPQPTGMFYPTYFPPRSSHFGGKHSPPHLHPRSRPSHPIGSRYRRGLMIMEGGNWTLKARSLSLSV